ncbi:hypothetical protein JCM10908_003363 [Rhodotorula pacifica]|uniref:uncharacterized protein n=1 Tax=Rhodotorula pacifica TaxID=1495444 RepID=UPI003172A177
MSDNQVVERLLHPQVGALVDQATVRSELGDLAPKPTSVNIDPDTFKRLLAIATGLRAAITDASDTASAGEQTLFLLDAIVNPHLQLDAARASEWRRAVEPASTESPSETATAAATKKRAKKSNKTWQEKQRDKQDQYEKDMASIATMLKDYTTFATIKDVPWSLSRWLHSPSFISAIVSLIKQAARLSWSREPFPGAAPTSREEASKRLVGLISRAVSLAGGYRYSAKHMNQAVIEAEARDEADEALKLSVAGPSHSQSSSAAQPQNHSQQQADASSRSNNNSAAAPVASSGIETRPASSGRNEHWQDAHVDEANEQSHDENADEPRAVRACRKGVNYEESGDPPARKPRKRHAGQASPADTDGTASGVDVLDKAVPESTPPSEDDTLPDPSHKKRKLNNGKDKAMEDMPDTRGTTETRSAADSPRFIFPILATAVTEADLPEAYDIRKDLPLVVKTPSLGFSIDALNALNTEQSRALAEHRPDASLSPYDSEKAILDSLDSPKLKHLALSLHSLAQEACTRIKKELVSTLAVAQFQHRYIERCQATLIENGLAVPTMARQREPDDNSQESGPSSFHRIPSPQIAGSRESRAAR